MKRHTKLLILFLLISSVALSQTVEEADSLYRNYEFDKALEVYEKLSIRLTRQKKAEEAQALEPLIEKTERAARMLLHCEDVQIIDSIIIDKSHFIDAYLISSDAGYLREETGRLYYINQLQNKRYFARMNTEGYFRLFSEIKLQDQWENNTELSLPYDQQGDYNYPFVLPDGVTLYFASTAPTSLGGYDLYISRYNYASETYFAPSQLGMPFNSPANDYMLAIDEINNIGYFATDRFQPDDKVVVYTYIPNQAVNPVGSEDKEYLKARAQISAIGDSWKMKGSDYKAYIQDVKNYIANEQQKAGRDFTFVINDNIVYHTLDDFDNPAARRTFLQLQDLRAQLDKLEADLDAQRKEYARANSQVRAGLRDSILQNERQLIVLQNQYNKTETEARNLEIRQLRTKN